MIPYYTELAVRSFRRNRILTALMICAIAVGIGASMTAMTVLYVLSADPIPAKSDRLFYVQLAPNSIEGYEPGDEPASQLTRFDAEALLRAKRGARQAMMTAGNVSIEPARAGLSPFFADARYTSADFFAMFEAPIKSGASWTAAEDEGRARVAVISAELSDKLFPDEDAVGKTIRLRGTDFTVVGVLERWRLTPHFYDLNIGSYAATEQIYMPISTSIELEYGHNGSMSCWGDTDGDSYGLSAPCVWLQFWVELDEPNQAAEYRDFLESYSDEQRAAGRFERPTDVRFRNVMQWLEHNEVVPGDVRLQAWLAFGFLLVCLLNTVGLLLAKFMRRSGEIGVRRALGASRGSIFSQLVTEAAMIGLVGAVFGVGLVLAGLWAVRLQPTAYAKLLQLDTVMLAWTVGLAIFSTMLASLIPAWRACFVSPALQVKAQ